MTKSFLGSGEVDLESTDRLADFYIEEGVTGISVLSMMAETQTMVPVESELFLKRFMSRVDGQAPAAQ